MDAPAADLRAPRGRYGPFCSYPYVPRPKGEYGALWYGNDERAKHFLSHTRIYNCAYAFSLLHATRIKRKGKPVFQLRGAVYYRIAPAMVSRRTGTLQPRARPCSVLRAAGYV